MRRVLWEGLDFEISDEAKKRYLEGILERVYNNKRGLEFINRVYPGIKYQDILFDLTKRASEMGVVVSPKDLSVLAGLLYKLSHDPYGFGGNHVEVSGH